MKQIGPEETPGRFISRNVLPRSMRLGLVPRRRASTAADPRLTPLASGILAAAELGIAGDSLAFCHALALREIGMLDDQGLLRIVSRDQGTSAYSTRCPIQSVSATFSTAVLFVDSTKG